MTNTESIESSENLFQGISGLCFLPYLRPKEVHDALQQAPVLQHGLLAHARQALEGGHHQLAPR